MLSSGNPFVILHDDNRNEDNRKENENKQYSMRIYHFPNSYKISVKYVKYILFDTIHLYVCINCINQLKNIADSYKKKNLLLLLR